MWCVCGVCVVCVMYVYMHMSVQWNPLMRTPSGCTSSVLVIEVSFIQGLELFNVTCLGPRDSVLFVEVSVFQGVHISGPLHVCAQLQ